MTAEWKKKKKKKWSKVDILAEAAAMVYEQEQHAKKGKSKMTVSEEEEESDKRFFYNFPRNTRSWVTIKKPQNCFQNLNGDSTSSSRLLDLNQTPYDFEINYLQLRRPSPSFLGDYMIAADPEKKNILNPRFSEPSSSSLLLHEYNRAESEKMEMKNPPNPNSQLFLSTCLTKSKSRKRRAVQQRKKTGGLKKAKIAPFSWIEKETPEWLLQVMRDMDVAGDAKLIFEKVLSWTDVNPTQSRLLIPFNKLHRNDESRYIRGQGGNNGDDDGKKPGVKAILVNQSSEKWSVNFKIWEMKKGSGKGSLNYALSSGWNNIVEANGLDEDHNISLWSFRCQDVLYFALVRPPTMD